MLRRFLSVSLLPIMIFILPLPPVNANAAPVIVVLGDSLSAAYGIPAEQGWVQLLQNRLKKQSYSYRVVNASVSGETTHGGLTRLPRLLQTHRPQLLLIALGANDGLRGLPVKQMRQNLSRMIELAQKSGSKVMLIGMQIPPNYGPVYTRQFSQTYTRLSNQTGSALVPFLLDGIADKLEFFQADRLHPTAVAQPRLLENIWPTLKQNLKP